MLDHHMGINFHLDRICLTSLFLLLPYIMWIPVAFASVVKLLYRSVPLFTQLFILRCLALHFGVWVFQG